MPVNTEISAERLRQSADELAAGYPALLAEAERVAALVAAGVHGRRRAGAGETFWQYRPYDVSDPVNRIDWRRSARGDDVYVRDTEWEAANSVYIWRDGSGGMDWRSSNRLPTKKRRGTVLALALASLLTRAGERCAVLGESARPRSGRAGYERIADRLARSDGAVSSIVAEIPAHAKLLLVSDFLDDPEAWPSRLAALAGRPTSGVLLHVIDPAEEAFPFRGRVELRMPSRKLAGSARAAPPFLLGRAERAREDYQRRFAAHCERLDQAARRLGFTVVRHRTDQPARQALTALYETFAGGPS